MRKIICDRCGAEIPKDGTIGQITLVWLNTTGHQLAEKNPVKGWDFCESCMSEITAFIDKKKPEDEGLCFKAAPEPEEEAEADSEEDPEHAPPDPPKEYKGVNLRRLRELVKAGKTAQEIAAELGCSVATYYKHRKRAEELWNKGLL